METAGAQFNGALTCSVGPAPFVLVAPWCEWALPGCVADSCGVAVEANGSLFLGLPLLLAYCPAQLKVHAVRGIHKELGIMMPVRFLLLGCSKVQGGIPAPS